MTHESLSIAFDHYRIGGDFEPTRKVLRLIETRRKGFDIPADTTLNNNVLQACLEMAATTQDLVLFNTTLKLIDILPLSKGDKTTLSQRLEAALEQVRI